MKKLKIFESSNDKYDNFVLLLAPSENFDDFKSWYNQNVSTDKSDGQIERIFNTMLDGTGQNSLFKKYALGGKEPLKGIKVNKDRGYTSYYVDPQEASDNGWTVDSSSVYGDVNY